MKNIANLTVTLLVTLIFSISGARCESTEAPSISGPEHAKTIPWTYKDGWNGVIPGVTKFTEVVKRFGPIRDDDASAPWYKTVQTRHQGTKSIYYLKNGAISVDVTKGNDFIDSIKIRDFADEPEFPKTLEEAEERFGKIPFAEFNGPNRVFVGKGISASCYNKGTMLAWIAFWVPDSNVTQVPGMEAEPNNSAQQTSSSVPTSAKD